MKYDIENINERKKKVKIAKKVIDVIIIILLYNIILVFISCLNKIDDFSLFGYKAYIITTDSMKPSINVEDVSIVMKTKEDKIETGDVITFKQGDKVITHRITNIEEQDGKKLYTTKGDNNNIEDNDKIEYSQIEGKNVLTIPKLGYLINALENQVVFLFIVLILLILLFFKIKKEEKKEHRREKKKIEQEKRNKD